MRIALVSRFAWPSVGGTESVLRTAATELARRHDVEVFAHRIDGEGTAWRGALDRSDEFQPRLDPESGVRTTQLRLTATDLVRLAPFLLARKTGLAAVPGLASVSRGAELWHARVAAPRFASQLRDAEIVHRFGGNRMALATVRAAKDLGRPVVVTPLAHPGQWDDDDISACAYREADLIVATSPADASTYLRLGVPADRIEICPLPSHAAISGGGKRLRESGLVTGPLVLFLGARRPHKGTDSLLGAAAILATQFPSAQVAFVGPGPPLPSPAPANVLDIGEVGDEERDAWLDAADVVCLPSSNESWGLAVSEAWSVGIPVVTSNIPVLEQRVSEAGGGIAVTPNPQALADALARLLRDDALREEMGRSGHAHYRRHLSPAAFAAWHEEAYRRLLS